MRLYGTGLPVFTLGHVEDHGMGVELRRGIPRDRPRRVVLEGRGGELSCRLGGMDVADPRLGVVPVLLPLQSSVLLLVLVLTVLALGHIEDHGMGMELRRGVARDRPRGVVLEGRGGELARRLRGMDVANPRLRVVLDLA